MDAWMGREWTGAFTRAAPSISNPPFLGWIFVLRARQIKSTILWWIYVLRARQNKSTIIMVDFCAPGKTNKSTINMVDFAQSGGGQRIWWILPSRVAGEGRRGGGGRGTPSHTTHTRATASHYYYYTQLFNTN